MLPREGRCGPRGRGWLLMSARKRTTISPCSPPNTNVAGLWRFSFFPSRISQDLWHPPGRGAGQWNYPPQAPWTDSCNGGWKCHKFRPSSGKHGAKDVWAHAALFQSQEEWAHPAYRVHSPWSSSEFSLRGFRQGPIVERSQSSCPYGVLMVWRLNRNRRGGLVLPQRDYLVLNVRQHSGRSQWMLLLLHFKIIWIFSQGAVSVDSLAELEDGALLMRTLQLSHLSFPIGQRLLGSKRKMSLNPIAQQVPQVVETCCKFIEEHGKEDIHS